MRQTQIFAGSSHPELVDKICERLGCYPAVAELGKFSNGETKVQLAVMPYFPYSRQSKKKSHRGSITARMVANLLHQAGVNHVITIDLHANQMQGFFHCPVDNLVAEPLIAHWIKANIKDWKKAVVVSKNPGGTKRVTSLADALKLNFGIVMTDRRRPGSQPGSMRASMILDHPGLGSVAGCDTGDNDGSSMDHPSKHAGNSSDTGNSSHKDHAPHIGNSSHGYNGSMSNDTEKDDTEQNQQTTPPRPTRPNILSRVRGSSYYESSSPLRHSYRPPDGDGGADADADVFTTNGLERIQTAPSATVDAYSGGVGSAGGDGFSDEDSDTADPRSRDVVTGRLFHGHIIDDDAPSPSNSLILNRRLSSDFGGPDQDPMTSSINSFHSISAYNTIPSTPLHLHHTNTPSVVGLGGSADAAQSSDEEEDALVDPRLESTVTLVGNVRDRPVILLDDMIDKSASWIAAAETVIKRGGATAVYCIATHGLFGNDALREMQLCHCIDGIVVTDAFPVPESKTKWSGGSATKLRIMDVSRLLAEAIRRNHHGESMEQLFLHYD